MDERQPLTWMWPVIGGEAVVDGVDESGDVNAPLAVEVAAPATVNGANTHAINASAPAVAARLIAVTPSRRHAPAVGPLTIVALTTMRWLASPLGWQEVSVSVFWPGVLSMTVPPPGTLPSGSTTNGAVLTS